MTEERIAILETQMEQVLHNQDRYDKEATEWRNRFCIKLDRVLDKLDNRPCVEHGERLKQVGTIGAALWGLCLVLVPITCAGAFYIVSLANDVEHIKNTSYGYRGIKVVQDGKV